MKDLKSANMTSIFCFSPFEFHKCLFACTLEPLSLCDQLLDGLMINSIYLRLISIC